MKSNEDLLKKLLELNRNETPFDEKVSQETDLLLDQIIFEIERIKLDKKIQNTAIAKKLDVSPSYISQVFRYNKRPNLKMLVSLALAVGVTLNVEATDDIEAKRSKIAMERIECINEFEVDDILDLANPYPLKEIEHVEIDAINQPSEFTKEGCIVKESHSFKQIGFAK